MNRAEAAILLGIAAAFDRRTVGRADAEAWATALHDVSLDDAKDAVTAHYAATTDYLMPAHIRAIVTAARSERPDSRTVDAALLVPDADPDDVPAYLEARRAGRYRTDPPALPRRPVRELLGRAFRHTEQTGEQP